MGGVSKFSIVAFQLSGVYILKIKTGISSSGRTANHEAGTAGDAAIGIYG